MSETTKARKPGRLKKFLLYGTGGLFGLLLLAWGAVYFSSESKISAQIEFTCDAIEIPQDEAAKARGRYLVNHIMGCNHSDCHRADFGGGAVIDAFPMGTLNAPNITSGKGGVIHDFQPVDWVRIIRHGLKKDGRRALVMPSEDWWNFSDSDIAAVIAYMKSVPPVDRESLPHSPGPMARMLLATSQVEFAYEKIDHKSERPRAAPGPTREWGEVLVGTCAGCHGPNLSGGPIPGTDPSWAVPRNITPDEQTGIGKWNYEQFSAAVRAGMRPDGTQLDKLMPWQAFAGMADDDVRALWAYLRSVPARPEGGR